MKYGSVLVLACLAACGEPPPPPRAPTTAPTRARSREPTARPLKGPDHSTGMSYDDALSIPEDASSLAGERELSNRELSQPMQGSSFLGDCNVPDATHVTVKVAIRDGAAMGVTVTTDPDDPTVAECVDKAVRALSWPASKHRDSFTTTY